MNEPEAILFRKGVDLLVDWLRSRWAARREGSSVDHETNDETVPTDSDVETARQAILRAEIAEAVFRQHERELRSVIDRFEIHRRNLEHLEAQKARWGDSLAPLIIINGIADESRAVDECARRLSELFEIVTARPLPLALSEPSSRPGLPAGSDAS